MQRIAKARLERGSLEYYGTNITIRKTIDPSVFLAEANTPRQKYDRRHERKPEEVNAERIVL